MGYIYCVTNTLNGKQYVGQTTQSVSDRWKQHCAYGTALHKAIKKYGTENFQITVLAETNNDFLNPLEAWFVFELQSVAPNGYNLTTGGESYGLSDDTKKKISESNNGKKMSITARAKMSAKKLHIIGSLNPFYGKSHTPETKETNAQKHRIAIKCIDTGIVYSSAKQASLALNINHSNITQVLKNKRKSAGGLTFCYANGQ